MPQLDETHDASRRSWVASANGHPDFPLQNLPLGIFAPGGAEPRAGTAIGDK
ncbi:MAG: fumarylacetoacetase, partial [Hyphomicrobiales bacterium]